MPITITNGRLFMKIPVSGMFLYVLVNVTLFSFSPTRLVSCLFAEEIPSVSDFAVSFTVFVPFSITVTDGVYPSCLPISVTTYLVPAGKDSNFKVSSLQSWNVFGVSLYTVTLFSPILPV